MSCFHSTMTVNKEQPGGTIFEEEHYFCMYLFIATNFRHSKGAGIQMPDIKTS